MGFNAVDFFEQLLADFIRCGETNCTNNLDPFFIEAEELLRSQEKVLEQAEEALRLPLTASPNHRSST